MSVVRPRVPWALIVPGLAGFGLLAALAAMEPTPETPIALEEVPDRYTRLLLPDAPVDGLREGAETAGAGKETGKKRPAARKRTVPAGRARKEEGKVGLKVGALPASEVNGGAVGGVIGAKGNQIVGVGGLGTRGVGLGGGGSAMGLGSGGTKGRSGGAQGYGKGAGAQGYGKGAGAQGYGKGAGQARLRAVDTAAASGVLAVARSLDKNAWGEGELREQNTTPAAAEELYARQLRGEPLPLTATADDALSTFAADVDTGSYTLARRSLREGALPDPGTVRVEEFVNYWRYDYGQPAAGVPVTASSELMPHPDHAGRHLLRVGVQARTVAAEARKPVRLTLLVDVSGSMRGSDRLSLIQQALHHAVDRLGPEDTVAIVTYAGRTEILAPPTPMSRRATLHRAIDRLTTGGGTDMGSGIALAYAQAEASWVEGAENRVMVLSDGDANIGQTGPEGILGTIRRHAEGGISLTTLGFGRGNYRDGMMEKLADAGDGAYVYIDSLAEAQRVLGTDLGATLETVGRDLKIQVDFDPGAVLGWRQVGYVNRQIADHDFRNDAVDAGEVGSGHQVTALYELRLAPDWQHRGSVGTVRLRAKPPGPDRAADEWTHALTGSLRARPTPDSRMATAAMHLADGLRTRREGPLQAAREEARGLHAEGRRGAGELATLAETALGLVGQGEVALAHTGRRD